MQSSSENYLAIGVMSGSSLDGLDIALCKLHESNGKWSHEIIAASCQPFDAQWLEKLRSLPELSARDLCKTHTEFGRFIGEAIVRFLLANHVTAPIDCIASHGHTVFHFPEEGFTTQIGDGASIAAITGITTVCDLRSTDVALGGTGAPVVPLTDLLLFPDAAICLNLGGIANLSVKNQGGIVAFDSCPCNQVLDFFAAKAGMQYDDRGAMASKGKIQTAVLNQLLQLPFHAKSFPKSLDNSFSKSQVIPILEQANMELEDKLCTAVEYIAMQLSFDIVMACGKLGVMPSQVNVLTTGGGAFNSFLLERLSANCAAKICLPDNNTIKYKEALAMALMGVLRLRNEANVLSAVTAGSRNSINGAVYLA